MPQPLLYKPPPSWQFWAAFAGAILIEAGSVVIAGMKHEAPAVDLSQIPTATVEATLQPEDQPTPPPEDIPIQEPPPIPDVAEFHEEKPPPPKTNKPTGPVKAPQGVTRNNVDYRGEGIGHLCAKAGVSLRSAQPPPNRQWRLCS